MQESQAIKLPFSGALNQQLIDAVEEALAAIRAEGRRRIFAMVNQKGGAGKTTTALTLAAVWASWGLLVRIVDCDPSAGSVTFWVPPIYPEDGPRWTLRDVYLGNCTLDEATYPTSVEGLYIVPSDLSLEEIERAQTPGGEFALAEAIEASTRPFDVTVLDTRPTLGLLTTSAMTAADEMFLTLGASGLDTAGLGDLAKVRNVVVRRLNPRLTTTAVVVCADDPTPTTLANQVKKALREEYPDAIHAYIPRSVKTKEATLVHLPLTEWAPRNTATNAYVVLAARALAHQNVQKGEGRG